MDALRQRGLEGQTEKAEHAFHISAQVITTVIWCGETAELTEVLWKVQFLGIRFFLFSSKGQLQNVLNSLLYILAMTKKDCVCLFQWQQQFACNYVISFVKKQLLQSQNKVSEYYFALRHFSIKVFLT